MDNLFSNECVNAGPTSVLTTINYRRSTCPHKNNSHISLMIYCLDNQQRLNTKPSLIVSRSDLTTYDFSLNRLFELAKEEHMKKQKLAVKQS